MILNVALTPDQIAHTSLLLDRLWIVSDEPELEPELESLRELWDKAYQDMSKLTNGVGLVTVKHA